MSLQSLRLLPDPDLGIDCAIGHQLPLSEQHLFAEGWSSVRGRLVLELVDRTVFVDRESGVVTDIVPSEGLTLLGVDTHGQFAIFSHDSSWSYALYNLTSRLWMDDDDPDFPRFVLEENEQQAWIVDLDNFNRYILEEHVPLVTERSA